MNVNIVTLQLGDGTDGLASAYQRTELTGAGYAAVQDTAGSLVVSLITLPSWLLVPAPSSPAKERQPTPGSQEQGLAGEMVRDANFRELTERGLADIYQGRYSRLEDVKRRLGDI